MFFCVFLYAESSFQKGIDYIELKTPLKEAHNSVIEIFSYRCIHCYNHYKFETLKKLKAKIPELNYRLYHTNFQQGYWKELNNLFAYAYAKDLQNNQDAAQGGMVYKLAGAYFDSYFVQKQDFENQNNLDGFYEIGLNVLGISLSELEAFMQTAEAKQIISQYEQAEPIALEQGTPTFIVNGKYQIMAGAFDSLEVLALLIEDLMKMP